MIRNYISEDSYYGMCANGNLDGILIEVGDKNSNQSRICVDLKNAKEFRDTLDRTIAALSALKNTPNKPLDKDFPFSPCDKLIREQQI